MLENSEFQRNNKTKPQKIKGLIKNKMKKKKDFIQEWRIMILVDIAQVFYI